MIARKARVSLISFKFNLIYQTITDEKSSSTETKELMPAEMYVPNQEQWLELRANRGNLVFKPPFCCGHVK